MADENVFGVGATMTGHYGVAATTGVTFAETTFAAMWNVQGDARRSGFAAAAHAMFALSLPVVAEQHRARWRAHRTLARPRVVARRCVG